MDWNREVKELGAFDQNDISPIANPPQYCLLPTPFIGMFPGEPGRSGSPKLCSLVGLKIEMPMVQIHPEKATTISD